MEKSILITGGARSGKSTLAERLALKPTGRAIYIATAEAFDDEMAARIAEHQARRGPEWRNLHAPLDLVGALEQSDGGDPRLVDCLTLWLTNLMLGGQDWRAEADRLITTLSAQKAPVVFVTNEVGAGIVPEIGSPASSAMRRAGSINPWLRPATRFICASRAIL